MPSPPGGVRYRAPGLGGAPGFVEEYTSSLPWDRHIAVHAVDAMIAHLAALHAAGAIPCSAASAAAWALRRLRGELESGGLPGRGYEDVFEYIEARVAAEAGPEATWAWLGRSRNDHVAAALRLYARERLLETLDALAGLRGALLDAAGRWASTPMPTFTHGQVAQASTAGHVLAAYEEALAQAWRPLRAAYEHAGESPLGSSAGAGTTVPLDRRLMAGLLGFDGLVVNTYRAVAGRLFLLEAVAGVALLYAELSRVAEDLVALAELGLARLPEGHLATSSVMPHKRNPVTLEVLRARAADMAGMLQAVLSGYSRQRYGYNLDLQELNKHLYAALEEAPRGLRVLSHLIAGAAFDGEAAARLMEGTAYWGAELAEALTLKLRVPFREAHAMVARALRGDGWRPGPRTMQLARRVGLEPSPSAVAGLYRVEGSPARLGEALQAARARLGADGEWLEAERRRLGEARGRLLEALEGVESCA